MKRFVWLLLAVFCATMAQVQPVDSLAKAKMRGCCRIPGACGMPGCCPAPASTSPVTSASAGSALATAPAARRAQTSRGVPEKFYASFAERLASRPLLPPASADAARSAYGPLFAAHCSFLI
jgi:hypothetical protein